jgi:hypothetical protein
MIYQAILLLAPPLLYLFNRRIARILLALVLVLFLIMGGIGYAPLGFDQVVILVTSLALLVDQEINPQMLSLVSLVSILGLPGYLPLFSMIILIFLALSAKGTQGKIGLYALIVMPLTILLQVLGYQFADLPILLVLLGVPPFHGWLSEMYSKYRSIGILVSMASLMYLFSNRASYLDLLPLILILGVIMILSGIFQGMVSKSLANLSSAIHQVTFGLLIVASQVNTALFIYALIPSTLSLIVINSLHYDLLRITGKSGIFDFGGLSATLRSEATSILLSYLTIISIMSLGAEVFMRSGISGDLEFVLLGCATIFTVAATLAMFFRGYTLIYEGLPMREAVTSGKEKYHILAFSFLGIFSALIPVFPLGVYSFITSQPIFQFDAINVLLLIIIMAAMLSIIFTSRFKPVKRKSWFTGYAGIADLGGSRGEVFTSWAEIFKPVYTIRVPDDRISAILERLNPVLILLVLLAVTVIGVMI